MSNGSGSSLTLEELGILENSANLQEPGALLLPLVSYPDGHEGRSQAPAAFAGPGQQARNIGQQMMPQQRRVGFAFRSQGAQPTESQLETLSALLEESASLEDLTKHACG